MRISKPRRWALAGVVALGALVAATPASAQAGADTVAETGAQTGGMVILVRHAETAPDGTRDPALSDEGRTRAARLASILSDAELEAVYTTDYGRTRGTARAVAEALGVEPTVYDPGRLDAFARALEARGGRVLVVGHSNTTPVLVDALGGDPGPPIAEDEHDRLYVLFLDDDGVRTLRLRY